MDSEDIERERKTLAVRSNMLARRLAHCTELVKVVLISILPMILYVRSVDHQYAEDNQRPARSVQERF